MWQCLVCCSAHSERVCSLPSPANVFERGLSERPQRVPQRVGWRGKAGVRAERHTRRCRNGFHAQNPFQRQNASSALQNSKAEVLKISPDVSSLDDEHAAVVQCSHWVVRDLQTPAHKPLGRQCWHRSWVPYYGTPHHLHFAHQQSRPCA